MHRRRRSDAHGPARRQPRLRATWCLPLALLGAACGGDADDPAGANPSTDPSTSVASDRPGPMALCVAPEAPHVVAFDRTSGDVRWVACGEDAGFRYLEQVNDGMVYLLHVEQPAPDRYRAFDADDGQLVPDATAPAPRVGPTGQPGSPPSTVVDGITISGAQEGPTRAADASGRELWTRPGRWVYDDVAAIDDGAVFALEIADTGVAELVAYEIDTGEVRWAVPGETDPTPWGLSPWVADDGQLFAGWTNLHVRDTSDGTPIWSTDWPTTVDGAPTAAHIAGVAVDAGSVYIGIVTQFGPGD